MGGLWGFRGCVKDRECNREHMPREYVLPHVLLARLFTSEDAGSSHASASVCPPQSSPFLSLVALNIPPLPPPPIPCQAISQVRTVYSFVAEETTLAKYMVALQDTLKLGIKVRTGARE